jgi:16S rRNA (guanine527-N7)-methyltransferase
MHDEISKYFPQLPGTQKEKLSRLSQIYTRWNSMINVISRKDIDNFNIHHVLHSLAIAKAFSFPPGSGILDVGTGGGFPGIPLAIVFPEVKFTLLDSIEKKIKVVRAVAEELELGNVIPVRARAEDEKGKFNFVLSRAVTAFPVFVKLIEKNVNSTGKTDHWNGIICLKGGDLSSELGSYRTQARILNISDYFEEPFFETKKIVYLPF